MIRYTSHAIKSVLAFVLIASLAVMTYICFEKDAIADRLTDTLCNSITTDLYISDKQIDFISHFPYITVDLKKVAVSDTKGKYLLNAHSLQASINPLRLLSDRLEISKLRINNGTINISRDRLGKWNYMIFQEKQQGESNKSFSLDVSKALLSEVRLEFNDQKGNQQFTCLVQEGAISGTFSPNSLSLRLDMELFTDKIDIGGLDFCREKSIKLKGKLLSDNDDSLIQLKDCEITIPGAQIDVSGTIHNFNDHTKLNLEIQSNDAGIRAVATCLPQDWQRLLNPYELNGQLTTKGLISGKLSQSENPKVDFDFKVKDGQFKAGLTDEGFSHIISKGHFDNGPLRNIGSSILMIDEIAAESFGRSFQGAISIKDLADPVLSGEFSGPLPLSLFLNEASTGIKAVGYAEVKSAEINDFWISQADFTDIKSLKALATLHECRFEKNGSVISLDHGQLHLEGDSLVFDEVSFVSNTSKGKLKGAVSRLGDALESKDPAYFHYRLEAELEYLKIDDFIHVPDLFNIKERDVLSARSVNNTGSSLIKRIPTGKARITAKQFEYGTLRGQSLDANIATKISTITYQANWDGMSGTIASNGTFSLNNKYHLTGDLSCKGIDMSESFRQCGNFMQQVVTSKQLSGNADIHALLEIPFDHDGNAEWNELEVVGALSIEKGELRDIELLDQFSTYIHAEDLKHIRFGKLNNFIEIRNGEVFFPVLFIQSNAINLSVNGIHRFDNGILYNMKINAGQLAAQRMRKHDSGLSPLPARKEGTFNMYYTLYGNVENFDYRTDKSIVTSSFYQSEIQRDHIRRRLEEGFGISFDFIEPAEWEEIPEYFEDRSQKAPEYLDEVKGQ